MGGKERRGRDREEEITTREKAERIGGDREVTRRADDGVETVMKKREREEEKKKS